MPAMLTERRTLKKKIFRDLGRSTQGHLKSAYFRIEKIWLHIKNELMNEGTAVFTDY